MRGRLVAVTLAMLVAGACAQPSTETIAGLPAVEGGGLAAPSPALDPFVVDLGEGLGANEIDVGALPEALDLPAGPGTGSSSLSTTAAASGPPTVVTADTTTTSIAGGSTTIEPPDGSLPDGPAPTSTTPVIKAPAAPQKDSPDEICRAFELIGPTFPPDSADLTPDGGRLARRLALEIRDAPCGRGAEGVCPDGRVSVWVFGHTDPRPTSWPGGNQALSGARARAVAEVLRAEGLRVVGTTGFGADRPSVGPDPDRRTSAERFEDDRRTEIAVTCGA